MSDLEILENLQNQLDFTLTEIKSFTQTHRNSKILDETSTVHELLQLEFRTKDYQEDFYDVKFRLGAFELKDDKIVSLLLVNCKLHQIPDTIFQLKSLEKLILNSNSLTTVNPNIFDLPALRFVDLSNNDIVSGNLLDFPESVSLKALDLSYNKLTDFQFDHTKLPNIKSVFISGNRLIENIDRSIIKSESLWTAHNEYNKVFDIKTEHIQKREYEQASDYRNAQVKLVLKMEVGFFLHNCNIANLPPEVVHRGRRSILDYWRSLDFGDKLPINEVKIILVGEGGAGKTSLVKRWQAIDFNPYESQTHGININSVSLTTPSNSEIIGRLWDFGGQEIMHSTHQFFLSKRSIYVIVLDSRKDERVEYWLKHIESFGGESPVLVVINKIDENPSYDLNRKFLLNKYPSIVSFNRISCKTDQGFEDFKRDITSTLGKVQHLNTLWRKEWFTVKDYLSSSNKHFISYEDFKTVCNQHNVMASPEQDELLSFLSDLGIMLNFNDRALKNTSVLNPQWLTSAVYKIINSKEVARKFGVLHLDSLRSILPAELYPLDKQLFIVDIMKKFELCYSLDDNRILIPDLLGIEEIEPKFKPTIRFFITYSFLPKSIIPRFIVRLNKYIKEGDSWRTGAILHSESDDCIAIVKSDIEERKIMIEVGGPNHQARDFFSFIRFSLEDINRSFEKIQIEERIFVPGTEISVSYTHLLSLESRELDQFLPEGAYEMYSVSEILGTVTKSKKEQFEDRIMQHLEMIAEKFDDRETLAAEANKIIDFKPNFAGIGINVNAIVERILQKKKPK